MEARAGPERTEAIAHTEKRAGSLEARKAPHYKLKCSFQSEACRSPKILRFVPEIIGSRFAF
jgi:hypothetical protein